MNCLRHQKAPKCVATIDEYSAQFSWEKTRDNNNLKPLAGPTAKIKRIDERGQSTADNQFENYEEKLRFTSDESDQSESLPPPSPKSGTSRNLKRTHGRKRTSKNSDSIDLTENGERTCSPSLTRELERLGPRSRYAKSPRNKTITRNPEDSKILKLYSKNNTTETTLKIAPNLIQKSAPKATITTIKIAENRQRITDSLKSSLLVQLIDQRKTVTDHNYGVRDPAYAKTDIKIRSLLQNTTKPRYEQNQTVWCLEPPGLWFRGKIITVENSLLKIRMTETHVQSGPTTFITNFMNPHIRKNQPDTLAGCRHGDWVTVTDEDERGRVLVGEEAPARICHFGKNNIKVMLNNLREIELDLGGNSKTVGKNESEDPNSVQNWTKNQPSKTKKQLPCKSILPAYGIRDAAYALPFDFDKYHPTANKNNTTMIKNNSSNEFYEAGKIVQVFDFGRDGEGMWEDATIEDFCVIKKAVKIQYPNYSKRWGLWTDVQSPHIREYMPKTPPGSMISGGSRSPSKKYDNQNNTIFNPSKLSSNELDSYISKHFRVGKKVLSQWKGSDKKFYACTVIAITQKSSVVVEFTDGMEVEIKNLRWFRNCTGECTSEEWVKMESFAENEFWNKTGGRQMDVLYPYKDEK